jgi:WD40 repeat protein
VSVTPDRRRAVSASLDKTLRVWDLESGNCVGVFVAVSCRA